MSLVSLTVLQYYELQIEDAVKEWMQNLALYLNHSLFQLYKVTGIFAYHEHTNCYNALLYHKTYLGFQEVDPGLVVETKLCAGSAKADGLSIWLEFRSESLSKRHCD